MSGEGTHQAASGANALDVGDTVAGRYRIESLLGEGGFGAVYEAQHVELGRRVALKVLLPALARNEEVVTRFVREAKAAASIGHPGIVEVFDLGRDAERGVFLAMELLEGEELADRIDREGPLPVATVVEFGLALCDAMTAAHEAGVVHRDLKPQNVFLARRGRHPAQLKVLDFGIAKLVESERADEPLTRTGQVFGTPLYMSPEQLRGFRDIDARADVYALGVMLYELLAGVPPFEAEAMPELVLKIVGSRPQPLASLRNDVPPDLAALVDRAMEKERDARIPSALELGEALAELAQRGLPEGPPQLRRERVALTGLERTLDSATPPPPRETASLTASPISPAAPPRAPADVPPLDRASPEAPGTEAARPDAAGDSDSSVAIAGLSGTSGVGPRLGLALGALALAALALTLSFGDTEEPTTPAAAVAPPEPPAVAAPVPAPPSEAPPVAPPLPASLRVRSVPGGARVEFNGEVVCGASPCEVTVPGEGGELRVTRRGYAPRTVALRPPLEPELELRLEPRRSTPATMARTPMTPSPAGDTEGFAAPPDRRR